MYFYIFVALLWSELFWLLPYNSKCSADVNLIVQECAFSADVSDWILSIHYISDDASHDLVELWSAHSADGSGTILTST